MYYHQVMPPGLKLANNFFTQSPILARIKNGCRLVLNIGYETTVALFTDGTPRAEHVHDENLKESQRRSMMRVS